VQPLIPTEMGLVEAPPPRSRNPQARGEATRRRLAESMISLLEAGGPMPTVAAVADAAGVSVRLVYHHFHDVETLFRMVMAMQVARHWNTVAPVSSKLALEVRIDRTVRQRATLFDSITPVRRAGMARLDRSPDIAAGLTASDAQLRMWLEHTFSPELSAAGPSERYLLDAIDAAASWEAWDRLRRGQRLSVSAASDVMVRTLKALFDSV
jgi:TetR/AcrR family transcriptional regulator, regulator of autoinduction and epiphytic fitness